MYYQNSFEKSLNTGILNPKIEKKDVIFLDVFVKTFAIIQFPNLQKNE